jgi:hypothetical protein
MARGWGRSEEDQGAEKEQAKEARGSAVGASHDAVAAGKRRSLELSLARIEDLLSKTTNPARRDALESARTEIQERLAGVPSHPSG